MTAFTRDIEALGPFDADGHRLALEALRETVAGPRIRWLIGMETELVEKANVYGRTVDAERYRQLMAEAVRQEYEKALVAAALISGQGRMVRDLAAETGLALPSVAAYLVELEQAGRVQIQGYEGRDPMFVRQAA